MNAKLRIWNMILLTLFSVGAIVGWMLGKDPGQLVGLVTVLGVSQGALEAGNIGKRATFKKEAVDALRSTQDPAGGQS